MRVPMPAFGLRPGLRRQVDTRQVACVMTDDILRHVPTDQRDARGRWLPGGIPAGARPWRKGQGANRPAGTDFIGRCSAWRASNTPPRVLEILVTMAENPE